MATILLLNGPNLNMLGQREPATYGNTSLEQIEKTLLAAAARDGHKLHTLQSNAEYELVDSIQNCGGNGTDFIIFNPGAFTHSSIAIRDALLAVAVPFIEVHLSNTHARESFRRRSLLSDIAVGTIAGFGTLSYSLAIQAASEYLARS